MKWYKSLDKSKKVHIREVFKLALGQSLNDMLLIFTFSECMDILHNKLIIEGLTN